MYLPHHSATTVKAAGEFAFNQVQMLEFHVLHLTDYKRVLYLDSDIMPICNLDYIFELSSVTRHTSKKIWSCHGPKNQPMEAFSCSNLVLVNLKTTRDC